MQVADQRLTLAGPLPGSRKAYVQGSRPDLRVPVREIALSATQTRAGEVPNAPVRVYDTSGPYTDPDYAVDLRAGLPALRRPWILGRGDVEEYEGRAVRMEDDGGGSGAAAAPGRAFPGLGGGRCGRAPAGR